MRLLAVLQTGKAETLSGTLRSHSDSAVAQE